ncbi:hypothetical protein TIFTF001_052782 [Ficus carica]|uniref:DUF1985 domain-containing protein n=1 Tax=Ficus carica TaxID=3494 RepID=A0AA88JH41_FICCA|nr:hypothetical protein TIFTF001_052782 [Ficus carica]
MRLTDHSGMSDALWFEVGEDLSRFSINEFCLITNRPEIFCLANNLEKFNAFLWGVLSWEATRAIICNAVENRLSSKIRPLKKSDKVYYNITGFPHALLVWAYESIPIIAGKFTTKYVEVILRMLSWTSADNMKFDDVMSALTAIDEKMPKCFVMMPTDEELKDPSVGQLYLKNPTVVPQPPRKTPVPQPSTETNSEWWEFQKEFRRQVDSMNKKLEDLKNGQKKSSKLLRKVLKLLYNLNDNVEGNPTTAYHVSSRHKRNVQTNDSNALKTDSDDLQFGPQDDVFIDSDIGVFADKGVKAAMEFLNFDKEEGDEEKEITEVEYDKGEKDEIILKICVEYTLYVDGHLSKEKEEEKEDEEAKGEKEERKNEEAVNEQEESISDVVVVGVRLRLPNNDVSFNSLSNER